MSEVAIAGIGTLTTEHTASSYGEPVLIVDGKSYGPCDVVPAEGERAWVLVDRWLQREHRGGKARHLGELFAALGEATEKQGAV